jgi:hypothetical protein
MGIGRIAALAVVAATVGLGGCITGVKTGEYSRGNVGVEARVEPAVVLSTRYVTLTSAIPFGLGPTRIERGRGERISTTRRGLNIVVRLERTGETYSVVQGDDVYVAPGAQVWLEYGDRVRVIPRS